MGTKTISQLDSAGALTTSDVLEIEQSGVSKKVTVGEFAGSGLPVGMLFGSEFDTITSATFPAIPRNVNIDIDIANYPVIVPLLRDVKVSILGVTDFVGVISSANTSYSLITFVTSSAVTAMCTVLTQDAIVSNWLNTGQNATTGASTVDFTTSATSRVITINSVDYPIYPSTAASAISITSGTIIFEGKPTTGTVTANIYTYRIAGQATKARLRKIAGFVGVVAGDADGEVIAGFRKMDTTQDHYHLSATYSNNTGGGGANPGGLAANPQGRVTFYAQEMTQGTQGLSRGSKNTSPRTAGQYFYTWAGIYTP